MTRSNGIALKSRVTTSLHSMQLTLGSRRPQRHLLLESSTHGLGATRRRVKQIKPQRREAKSTANSQWTPKLLTISSKPGQRKSKAAPAHGPQRKATESEADGTKGEKQKDYTNSRWMPKLLTGPGEPVWRKIKNTTRMQTKAAGVSGSAKATRGNEQDCR